MRARRRRGFTTDFAAALCVVLCAGSAPVLWAQSDPYYNITEIKAKRLKNAVILTIKADGAMTGAHAHDWHYLSGGSPNPVDVLHLECPDGKSKVGDFVDIGMYPISHVELEPRSWASDGIGVNLRIKLYTPARVRHFRSTNLEGDWYWHPTMGCCFDGEPGRNKQSFVFTVLSDRFAPPEPPDWKPETQEFSLQDGPDDTYSLHCLNVPIDSLAHELGRRTGAHIMVDESVDRHITVNLPEMTVDELLHGIASGYGLALEDRGGQWVFSKGLPNNIAAYDTNVTRVVELDNLSPETALDLLPNFLLQYVKPSESQNALIVAGPPQLVEHVREDVAKIDVAPRQIRVSVAAVKIAESESWQHALHTEWAHGTSSFSLTPGHGELTYDTLYSPSSDTHATLRELDQRGTVDTLARAHISLVNGKFASLFLGQKRYVQVIRNTWLGDEAVAIPLDLGVRVNLGAWAGGDDIVLWLRPIVTALGGVDPTTNLPIVDRYETSGAIIVRSGHTLMLGGIRLRNESDVRRGVKRLAFVPPDRIRVGEDAEIALFVTAEIVEDLAPTADTDFSGRVFRDLRHEGFELSYEPLDTPPDGAVPPTETTSSALPEGATPPTGPPQSGRTES